MNYAPILGGILVYSVLIHNFQNLMILHYFIIDLMNKNIKLVYDGHNYFKKFFKSQGTLYPSKKMSYALMEL